MQTLKSFWTIRLLITIKKLLAGVSSGKFWGNYMKNLFNKSLLLSLLMGISCQAGSAETHNIKASEVKSYPHSSRHYYSVACSSGWTSHFYQTDENSCSNYTNGTQTYKTPGSCAWKQNTPPYNELREALNKEVGDLFCTTQPGVRSIKKRGEYFDVICLDSTASTFWRIESEWGITYDADRYYRNGQLKYPVRNWDEFEAKVARPYCEQYSKAPPPSPPPPPPPPPEAFNVDNSAMTWMKMNEHTYSYEEAKHFCERDMNNHAEFGSARWHLATKSELELLWTNVLSRLSSQDRQKVVTEFGLTAKDYRMWAQSDETETNGYVVSLNAGRFLNACSPGNSGCDRKFKAFCVKD